MLRAATAAGLTMLLLPATAVAAARLTAPATAPVGSRIVAHGSGLKPGSYTLVLAVTALAPKGVLPTVCSADVSSAVTARDGKVTVAGRLPARLACRQGAGVVAGYRKVKPGRYVLTLGVEDGPNVLDIDASFVKRRIRLTA
jgi:hypothetical protein